MKVKNVGPFKISIDNQRKLTLVTCKRRGSKLWRLKDGELEKLRTHVMQIAESTGYPVLEV